MSAAPPLAAARRVLRSPWFWLCAGLLASFRVEPALRLTRSARSATTAAASDQPVWVRFVMVGLGGFRGVVSETLWLRAARLQEQGRYFEQVQLAEWITTLNPRATDAWVFNSWNLAYNISAMMPRFADRLTWVDAGIALLRDRAIPANPGDARLYRELGWLFQNKIGEDMDPAHRHYKLALARSMEDWLEPDGAAPPPGGGQAQRLLAEMRMQAERMHDIASRFGALDWRLPNSHAIYWADCGLAAATGFEHQALRRMIHQNLVIMIERGRLTSDLQQDRYETAPAPGLIPATLAFFEETIRRYPGETDIFARVLALAIRVQARTGDPAGAQASYQRLRTLAGNRFSIPDFATLAGSTELDATFFAPLQPPEK